MPGSTAGSDGQALGVAAATGKLAAGGGPSAVGCEYCEAAGAVEGWLAGGTGAGAEVVGAVAG